MKPKPQFMPITYCSGCMYNQNGRCEILGMLTDANKLICRDRGYKVERFLPSVGIRKLRKQPPSQ